MIDAMGRRSSRRTNPNASGDTLPPSICSAVDIAAESGGRRAGCTPSDRQLIDAATTRPRRRIDAAVAVRQSRPTSTARPRGR
jgi:hypothetical protein